MTSPPATGLVARYRADTNVFNVKSGAVNVWGDMSGNGYSQVQDRARRPTLVTNAVNGRPVLRFAYANALAVSQASTWVVVQSAPPDGSPQCLIGTGTAAPPSAGDIAEVMFYDHALDDAELADLHAYVAAQYRIVPETTTLQILAKHYRRMR